MDYTHLPDNATRQIIDSITIFDEFSRTRAAARPFAGGMYWKKQGPYEYLVKTSPDNKQRRIGPRSEQTEKVFENFNSRKAQIQDRLRTLRAALTDAERLNKALKAGRVPSAVINVLLAIDEAGLGEHFAVVGTHALYAYETAAGVRIAQGALATQDVDLLWDARKRVQFVTDLGKTNSSILGILQRADASFERKEGSPETAINARGFEVDFLRRQPEGDDPHPFQFSDDEQDLWPIQAVRASILTNAPRFDHVVMSTNGRMAMMRTIAPESFVAFKRWMGSAAPNRPAPKRRRDLRQAQVVQALLDEGLLGPQGKLR